MFIITTKHKTLSDARTWYYTGDFEVWKKLPSEARLFTTKIIARISLQRIVRKGDYSYNKYFSFCIIESRL